MSPASAGAKLHAKQWAARVVDTLRLPRPAGFRILNYHSIVDVDRREPAQMTTSVALLREHLRLLAAGGFTIARASDMVDRLRRGDAIDGKTVVLTFDDGFADNYRLAFPVLRDAGAPATFFLITSALDGDLRRLRNPWTADYMDGPQARTLLASGLVDIGCHTATHRTVRGLGADALQEETAGAKRTLEDRLECAVTLFAYPFGSYGSWDDAAVDAVARAGFTGGFTTIAGVNPSSANPLLLRRSRVSWTDGAGEFERLLRGAYDWYERVQRLQRPAGQAKADG